MRGGAAIRSAARRARAHPDAGGAIVEFLGVTVLLMVPLVYGVMAIAQVQAASYAAEGASRAAARGAAAAALDAWEAGQTDAEASAAAQARALAVVDLALEDFGVAGTGTVEIACDPGCSGPGAGVLARVQVTVPLPGMPGSIDAAVPLHVTVDATGHAAVDTWEAP
ncbi:pilus assembly protein [Demequina activiva]|uniref:TadE-like protein n=1 Tax=Demequina activiva TaxID=1582364 RepID=A0A919Q392_9MICO|nr:pilus assembly protein [Demequina activiva]GIG53508.1 hypothetical protein Dac01nite_02600 [Demequina activiva]